MKITDNRKNTIYFKGIKIGNIFVWNNCAYIKIREVECDSQLFNSVKLDNGCISTFYGSSVIEHVQKFELIVK